MGTTLPSTARSRQGSSQKLSTISQKFLLWQLRQRLGIVEEEEFRLFSDPEDAILELGAEAELKESAAVSAHSAGASTDGAASSSDAATFADAPALHKSDPDQAN